MTHHIHNLVYTHSLSPTPAGTRGTEVSSSSVPVGKRKAKLQRPQRAGYTHIRERGGSTSSKRPGTEIRRLPALRPLILRVALRLLGTSGRSYKNTTSIHDYSNHTVYDMHNAVDPSTELRGIKQTCCNMPSPSAPQSTPPRPGHGTGVKDGSMPTRLSYAAA